MRWSELVGDVLNYLDANELNEVLLIGHSLGGKVGMRVASQYFEQLTKLVLVDIAVHPTTTLSFVR